VATTIWRPSGVSVRAFTATFRMPAPSFDHPVGCAESATNTPSSMDTTCFSPRFKVELVVAKAHRARQPSEQGIGGQQDESSLDVLP
jgi:hypothetical protein